MSSSSPPSASGATAPSRRFVVVRGKSPPRFFIHLLVDFLHRTDRSRRQIYFGDIDLATIAEAIGVTALAPGMRDQNFRARFRNYSDVVGTEAQRPVNILSVAQATGIPRETVRRKIKILVDRGVVTKKDGGYIFTPGFAQTPDHQARLEHGIRDTLHFMNDCLTMGLVRLAPGSGQLEEADGG